MRRARGGIAIAWIALFSAMFVACGEDPVMEPEPLTQIVVVLTTDLDVPARMDAIRLDVTGPSGGTERASASLTGDGAIALPATLGLTTTSDTLAPVVVVAEGRLGGGTVVSRRIETGFVEGLTLRLEVALLDQCFGRAGTCGEGSSCGEGGACVDDTVDPTTLPVFDE